MLPRIQRFAALAEGVGMIVLLYFAVKKLDQDYFGPAFPQSILSLVFAFLSLVLALICFQFVVCLAASVARAFWKRRSEAAQVRIAALLVAWTDGSVQLDELLWPAMFYRSDFEKVLLSTLGLLAGSKREKLADLALQLRFVARWRRLCISPRWSNRKESLAKLALAATARRRATPRGFLWDASPRVRVEAVRGLLRVGDPKDLSLAFETAVRLPLLSRILLAEELRPFAGRLASGPIPSVLAAGSNREILAVLSFLEAWNSAVRIPAFDRCLESEDLAIRAAAMCVAPLLLPPESALAVVEAALRQDQPALLEAAVRAAGRLNDRALLPALTECARAAGPAIARQAYAVLANLGVEGTERLESEALTASSGTAARAVEGLQLAYTRQRPNPRWAI
jgi:hypothetical protein